MFEGSSEISRMLRSSSLHGCHAGHTTRGFCLEYQACRLKEQGFFYSERSPESKFILELLFGVERVNFQTFLVEAVLSRLFCLLCGFSRSLLTCLAAARPLLAACALAAGKHSGAFSCPSPGALPPFPLGPPVTSSRKSLGSSSRKSVQMDLASLLASALGIERKLLTEDHVTLRV